MNGNVVHATAGGTEYEVTEDGAIKTEPKTESASSPVSAEVRRLQETCADGFDACVTDNTAVCDGFVTLCAQTLTPSDPLYDVFCGDTPAICEGDGVEAACEESCFVREYVAELCI